MKELLTGAKKKEAADDSRFAELSQARENDRKAFDELHTQLSTTGNGQPLRPATTGAGVAVTTDC